MAGPRHLAVVIAFITLCVYIWMSESF